MAAEDPETAVDFPLTRAQIREIDRRVKDARDRTRYLLASLIARRFVFFYNVAEDTYGVNTPEVATLFKRREAALAVRRLLDSRVAVLEIRVDGRGRLVRRSVSEALRRHATLAEPRRRITR